MTKTRFYLDTRNAEKGKPAPLKIAITKKGQAAFISRRLGNGRLATFRW